MSWGDLSDHLGSHENETNRLRWLEELRDTITQKDPGDLTREVPRLVDEINALSTDTDDTRRFLIGISFTQKHTCLDYTIERVIEADNTDNQSTESIVEPISNKHHYLRFTYPPDPHFDECALRALLLATIDQKLEASTNSGESPSGLSYLWNRFRQQA